MPLFFWCFLALFSRGVFACSDIERVALDKILTEVKQEIVRDGYSSLDFTLIEPKCKLWAAKGGLSIIVNPYTYVLSGGRVDEVYLGAVIAVVDASSGGLVSSLNDRRISEIDAISLKSMVIDTARYRLSENDVAFGVRFLQGNQSSANSLQEEFLNLYVAKGHVLKSVARGVLTSTYSGEGDGRCVFEGGASSSTLLMGEKVSNGKADIKVVKVNRFISSEKSGYGCSRSERVAGSVRFWLKFDGENYEVPEGVKSSLAM
ncbi:PA3715 family protein [Pseudomonas nicosulfuronedens]